MEFIRSNESSIIKVIGVGGGGSNAVNHMFRKGIKGVEFIVCNTDSQALEISPVPIKIQLGSSLTEGRGAGSIPEVGKNAAIENIDEMKKLLGENTKMVFITAGMGGGTGTGAAPIIAQAAKELGILTVGIVTIPFLFEGKKRKVQADLGIDELKKNVDTLLIISNDRVREMYGNLQLSSAFGHADDILTIAAKGIAEIITVTGYINVDFEDVKTVMTNSGRAIMGSAKAKGDDRATRAVEQALASPLLNDSNIKGARYILMNIASGSHEVTMDEIGSITDYIQDAAGMSADIIWGNCYDETLEDNVSVTIIATGFKTKQELGEAEKSKPNIHHLEPVGKKENTGEEILPLKKEKETAEPQLQKSDDMVLKHVPLTSSEREIIFVFDTDKNAEETIATPLAEEKPEAELEMTMRNKKQLTTTADNVDEPDMMDEQLKKSRERIEKLKAMSYRFAGNNNVNDLEKVPAYQRRNIKLDNVAHSSESSVSRFTLSTEDEKKTELRQNNSFLHDSVD